ncbi:MAG: hypothetical protein Q4E37_06305 [Tissierellia bacterium]|nr:hypothetical protein [Tissierellia bacterium]
MKERVGGLIILLVVIVAAGAYSFFRGIQPDPVEVTGLLGGEKIGLFESEDFKTYIKDEYGLTMDYRKAGSFDMVQGSLEGQDYLFPASQLAGELFKKEGHQASRTDIVFNTPVVLYSRKPVVEALEKEGLVSQREGVYYVHMEKLAKTIAAETPWKDLGLPQLYGNVLVDTTDPNKSNSGNMFLGLLANALNGNRVVDGTTAPEVIPDLQKIYALIGYMESSSADMFSQFLKQGMGSYPLIAGYENQLLEFSKTDPDVYQQIKDQVYILYPEPTVWSSHVYIALNPEAERGLEALKDPKIQDMAWKNHGFRTVVSGTGSSGLYEIPGLADDITQVMPMPDIQTMLTLMAAVE